MFYEQELAKKDKLVSELRFDAYLKECIFNNALKSVKICFFFFLKVIMSSFFRTAAQVAEFNARETQQASLTKDLLHHEMVEKLREEIKLLEGG